MAISKLPTNASLKEVMDKFEEISLTDFSSISVIVRDELPTTGKENQICILSNIHTENIVMSVKETDKPKDDNSIFMWMGADTNYSFVDLGNKTTKILLSFLSCTQLINGTDQMRGSYVYRSGEWLKLSAVNFFIYDNGSFLNTAYTGELVKTNTSSAYTNITNEKGMIKLQGPDNTFYAAFNNAIDLTNYSKFKVYVSSAGADFTTGMSFRIGVVNSKDSTSYIVSYSTSTSIDNKEITIDISNITGANYLKFYGRHSSSQSRPYMNITKIWLE